MHAHRARVGGDFLSDHLVAACCRVKARVDSVGDISRALEQELLVSTHVSNSSGSVHGNFELPGARHLNSDWL